MCCSVLQCVAVLQCWHLGSLTAANWVSFDFNVSYSSCWGYSLINILKLKKCCSVLHYTLVADAWWGCELISHMRTHCNTLQHTATHYNTLQHTATHCNAATHCNTLQHTLPWSRMRGTRAPGSGREFISRTPRICIRLQILMCQLYNHFRPEISHLSALQSFRIVSLVLSWLLGILS